MRRKTGLLGLNAAGLTLINPTLIPFVTVAQILPILIVVTVAHSGERVGAK